jgi:predicted Zn-dependent peptidase
VIAGDIDPQEARSMARVAAERLRLGQLADRETARRAAWPLRTGLTATIPGENQGSDPLMGLAWPQPPAHSDDLFAWIVADQLLLGGRTDPSRVTRAEDSPLAALLTKQLGARRVSDYRDAVWGNPPLLEGDRALHMLLFSMSRSPEPEEVRRGVLAAIGQVKRDHMSDAEIVAAREHLASFYERWFFEPNYRILSDHLAFYAMTGADPRSALAIPSRIRAVRPEEVRRAVERYLLRVAPVTVVLPPASGA